MKNPRARRVAIVCTGLGRVRRGFETHAGGLFDQLREDGRLDVRLFKGGGRGAAGEYVVPNLHRDSALNRALCSLVGQRRRYYIEYLSFAIGLTPLLAVTRLEVIYTLEAPIYKALWRWRRLTGARYRLIHTTSGQLGTIPADDRSFIHHCTPCYVEKADALGFARGHQFLIPQFLDLRDFAAFSPEARREARARLGLPSDRPIVLSVGSLDRGVKRMDYVIREVAALRATGSHDPYLVLLGQRDPETGEIARLAEQLLGRENHHLDTVSRSTLWEYYNASDAFTLASLREGFGFVYIEALAAGLPVLAHDYDVARFVLGDHGIYANLERPGELAQGLMRMLASPSTEAARDERRQYVQSSFDWPAVREQYVEMFLTVAAS